MIIQLSAPLDGARHIRHPGSVEGFLFLQGKVSILDGRRLVHTPFLSSRQATRRQSILPEQKCLYTETSHISRMRLPRSFHFVNKPTYFWSQIPLIMETNHHQFCQNECQEVNNAQPQNIWLHIFSLLSSIEQSTVSFSHTASDVARRSCGSNSPLTHGAWGSIFNGDPFRQGAGVGRVCAGLIPSRPHLDVH